jgi:hypothetical protein
MPLSRLFGIGTSLIISMDEHLNKLKPRVNFIEETESANLITICWQPLLTWHHSMCNGV